MWQTDWADGLQVRGEKNSQVKSELELADVDSVYLLHWAEHCTECAIPECYKTCPLYVARRDRKCARFRYGIVPNPQYPGLFPYGAEIHFRRWGKLESTFGFGAIPPQRARRLDRIDRGLLRGVSAASSALRAVSPNYRLSGAYAVAREQVLRSITRTRKEHFDDFVVEVWNLDSRPVRLAIECWQDRLKFRSSILLEPGRTLRRFAFTALNIDLNGPFGMIRVLPDNDAEAHLVFSWLDFVRYPPRTVKSGGDRGVPQSSTKVKCVIWDLDNTVWNGVLGEQDPNQVTIRPLVHQVMLALDERGILQSIASKNDHDNAWSVLQRIGVDQLFLYPKINWNPKSTNIREIVSALNIGSDTCIFVDDSPFEREEVRSVLPEIRTYSDSDVPALLSLPEFDVQVSAESRQRRFFYMAEQAREQRADEYGNDYEGFLRTCAMKATLFTPLEREHAERCLELLHRSNQLNLSPHRYSCEEYEQLFLVENITCIATSCSDRFGEYGIIGFASVESRQSSLFLKDFVLSCRVARKKLENAWFRWLISLAVSGGYDKIYARYVKTARNSILLATLNEVGFREIETGADGVLLELSCDQLPAASDIVSVTAKSIKEIPAANSREVRRKIAGR